MKEGPPSSWEQRGGMTPTASGEALRENLRPGGAEQPQDKAHTLPQGAGPARGTQTSCQRPEEDSLAARSSVTRGDGGPSAEPWLGAQGRVPRASRRGHHGSQKSTAAEERSPAAGSRSGEPP